VSAIGSDLAEITPASIFFSSTSPRAINNGNDRANIHAERRRKSARVIARLIYAKSRRSSISIFRGSAAIFATCPPPSSVPLPRIYGRAINIARRGKRELGGEEAGRRKSSGLPEYSRAIFDTRGASKRSLKADTRCECPRELETAIERQTTAKSFDEDRLATASE